MPAHSHHRRPGCLSLSSVVARQLAIIKTPRNAVELEIQLRDLALLVEREEVEAPDAVSGFRDVVELPVPDDLVRAGRANVEGVDAEGWRLAKDTGDPFLLVGRCAVAGQL